jgi:myo-inositol 2-dehydrogenase / D-chiro-inositol 1-dehydrogenase
MTKERHFMSELAIGVIGTGGMGTRHAVNLQQHVVGARVVAVYDLDAEHAAAAAKAVGGARVAADPLELIADPAVDAVVIASPDPTHAELAAACLKQQKPLLCEKPLATTSAVAREIVEKEAAIGRRLISVGFMRRFDPAHLAVKRVVECGQIGRPILFKGTSRAGMMPAGLPVATIMTNSAIHDLDAALWFLEHDVQEVFVRSVRTHDTFAPEARDLILISMGLGDACMADIEIAMAAEYGYDIEATVVGQRGVAETIQPDVALVRYQGKRGFTYQRDWLERFQTAYVAELESWVASLCGGPVFAGATAWDGFRASLVADACIEALHSGQPTPVHTPLKPDLY